MKSEAKAPLFDSVLLSSRQFEIARNVAFIKMRARCLHRTLPILGAGATDLFQKQSIGRVEIVNLLILADYALMQETSENKEVLA